MNDDKSRLKRQWFKEGKKAAETVKNYGDIEKVCEIKKNSLMKEMQPQIMRLNVEGIALVNEEKNLTASLSNSPTPIACGISCFQGSLWLVLSMALLVGTWAIWDWSLKPFRPDRLPLLVLSLTVASIAIGDILMKRIIEIFPERQRKIFTLFAILTAAILFLSAEVNFGIIRGSLSKVSLEMQHSASVEDADAVNTESENISSVRDFYRKGFSILNIVMPLLAVSLSIGTAIAFHEGLATTTTSGGVLLSHSRLGRVRRRMIAKGVEIKELEALPELCAAEFMRGALTAEGKGIMKESGNSENNNRLWLAILVYAAVLIAVLAFVSIAFSADSVVMAIDLTASGKGIDYKGNKEFQKNLKAVERIIMELKAGSRFMVIGITESSFSRPYIIMNKRLGDDPGYFGEKLREGKQILIKEWRKISKELSPDALSSDIFGAISLGAHSLQNEQNASKVLILLSDMRQCSRKFNFEKMATINNTLIEKTVKEGLIPDLTGVKVYVAGVHTIGKSQGYWESLKNYWQEYFNKAGADLKSFIMERGFNYE